MQFTVTSNKEHADKIRAAIKKNGGYCPCRIEKTQDTRCICKDFLKNTKPGEFCHCGLYKKIEE